MAITFRQQTGIGLIETLITFLLITGSVVALLQFQSYLAYTNNLAQQQATANSLALSEIETLRDFTVLTGSNSYANIASGSSSYTGTSATYTITWTVTTNSNPNYKVIDVTVTWTDRTGSSQSIRLTSQVAGIDPSLSAVIM